MTFLIPFGIVISIVLVFMNQVSASTSHMMQDKDTLNTFQGNLILVVGMLLLVFSLSILNGVIETA